VGVIAKLEHCLDILRKLIEDGGGVVGDRLAVESTDPTLEADAKCSHRLALFP
jgi:hypothetical protein